MPSVVELLSNPSPEVSTYHWNVSGLRHLDRKNKLSSLPFWVPNDVMKRHQFRIVLIRGIIAKEKTVDDDIGMVLELIPPPTGSNMAYPGGCSITARVINRLHEGGIHDIEQTTTKTLSQEELQVCFPELIPSTILDNPEFTEGDGPSLLLEITIQTGVNVTAERVTRTVSSVWATLSDSLNKIVQKATKLYSESREEYGTTKINEESKSVPWETIPENWVGREEEWHQLVSKTIVDDEGTFRYGPNRGFSKDEQAFLLQCGLNQRLITNVHAQFDYDRDVHEGLLTIPALRQQRYNLVPGKMKEEVFWANYFWKVSALSLCKNDEQVRLLLTVLNAPPAVKARDISSVRAVDEETVLSHIRDAQEAADMLVEYLTDDTPDGDMLVEAAVAACEGHAKQLDGYFKRSDLSESTLKMTGVVLKRIRERLREYVEWKSKNSGSLISEGIRNEISPSSKASEASNNNNNSNSNNNAEEKNNSTINTLQPSSSNEVLQETSVQENVDVDPSKISKTPIKEEDIKREDSTTDVGRGSSGAADVKFPLMPWEEEEEEENGKE